MITPTLEQVKALNQSYNMIPICKEIYADVITPIQLLRKVAKVSKN